LLPLIFAADFRKPFKTFYSECFRFEVLVICLKLLQMYLNLSCTKQFTGDDDDDDDDGALIVG